MKYRPPGQRGQALAEFAVVLPLLLLILLGLVETGRAIHVYLTIVEATREGALLAAREGVAADVPGLVETLTGRLPPSEKEIRVVREEDPLGAPMMTVEVSYVYKPIFTTVPLARRILPHPLQLRAVASMPAQ